MGDCHFRTMLSTFPVTGGGCLDPEIEVFSSNFSVMASIAVISRKLTQRPLPMAYTSPHGSGLETV
jgi:hypothetical protein